MKSNFKEMLEHSNKRPWITDHSHVEDRDGIQIWSGDEIIADVVPDQHSKQYFNAKIIKHCVNHFEEVLMALESAYFQFEHNGNEAPEDKRILDYMQEVIKHARKVKE